MREETSLGVASARSAETKSSWCVGRGVRRQRPFGRVKGCWVDSKVGKSDSTSGEFRQESSTSTEFLLVARCLKRLSTIG
jgi:hypothetical protein